LERWGQRALLTVSLALVAWLATAEYLRAASETLVFRGLPLNGAFQLFNPLRRMAEGQVPGRDFQFFHGLGIPYLHYPLFRLLGGDLFASEMARKLVSPLLFLVINVLFLRALRLRTSAALLLGVSLSLAAGPLYLGGLHHEGHSLQGVRSSMPFVMGAFLLYAGQWSSRFAPRPGAYRFELMAAVLASLAILFGTEQGLAALCALLVLQALFPLGRLGITGRVKSVLAVLGMAVVSTCVVHAIAARGAFLHPLKLALVDIPGDQFWYFGAPPNRFVWKLEHLAELPEVYWRLLVGLLLVPVVLVDCWRAPERHRSLAATQAFLLLYGLVSTVSYLGMMNYHYTAPLERVELLLVPMLALRLVRWLAERGTWRPRWVPETVVAAFSFLCLLPFIRLPPLAAPLKELVSQPREGIREGAPLGVALAPWWAQSVAAFQAVAGPPRYRRVLKSADFTDENWSRGVSRRLPAGFFVEDARQLEGLKAGERLAFEAGEEREILKLNGREVYLSGPLLDPERHGYPHFIWAPDAGILPGEVSLWSTYAGLLEARWGVRHPSVDYVIHALGDAGRAEYLRRFREVRPRFVSTARRGSTIYEEWLQNSTWEFYEDLARNYRPVASSPYFVFWEQRPEASWQVDERWDHELAVDGQPVFPVPLPEGTAPLPLSIWVVEVEYRIHNPWGRLPVLGKLPRFLLTPADARVAQPVSLPPHRTRFRFPVFLPAGTSKASLQAGTYSLLPGARLEITRVRSRRLEVPQGTTEALLDAPE
jgi:hypothetical protein